MLLISENKNQPEILINYFIVQAFNSYIYLIRALNLNYIGPNFIILLIFIINLSIFTKLGFPPFYLWYIKIINNINWSRIFILITFQKIIPLIILINSININTDLLNINFILVTISLIFCSIKGLNLLNLKILLAYSSIIQLRWIILLGYFNEIILINYFILYILIIYSVILIFKKFNLTNLINLNSLKFKNKLIFILLILIILSLARIPPTIGFLIKWISIQFLYLEVSIYLILLIIFNSLLRIYFYLRIILIRILINSNSIKLNFIEINYFNKFNFKNLVLIWISTIIIYIYEIF